MTEQRIAFEENMAKKESQMKELDRVSRSLSDELKALQTEVRVKRESEEQMKQVLKEYEKTISELIAEKEREKVTYEDDRLRLMSERDQANDDLKVRFFIFTYILNTLHTVLVDCCLMFFYSKNLRSGSRLAGSGCNPLGNLDRYSTHRKNLEMDPTKKTDSDPTI